MKYLHFLLLILVLGSCQTQDSTSDNIAFSSNPDKVSTIDIKTLQTPEDVINAWNKAINSRDYLTLAKLYDEEVQVYQDRFSNGVVLEKKQKYLESNPDFQQKITDFQTEQQYTNTFRVGFFKTFVINGKEKQVRATVNVVKDENKGWLIIGENDKMTRKKYENIIHECEDLMLKIIKSADNNSINELLENPNTILMSDFNDNSYSLELRTDGEYVANFEKSIVFDIATLRLYDIDFDKEELVLEDKSDKYRGDKELFYDKNLLKTLRNYCR